MKMLKKVLSIMMALVTLVSVVSISAEALTIQFKDEVYGYMVPVNNKGTKVLSTVKLYGSYDYLNFFIHSGIGGDVYFFYEIYSDKNLTNCVDSGYTICYYGNYNLSQKIKLTGKYKSKTYYAVTYAGMFSSNKERLTVDENSLCQFKIVVDRSPTYEEKKVALNSVKNTIDGPQITWSKISGTSKYYIYRRSITGTEYKKIGAVSGKKNSFVDTGIRTKDGNYIYTVKGIGKNGDVSKYHYNGITCLYAETPKVSSVSAVASNGIEIKWNKTSSKAKYNIIRKEEDGSWTTIKKNCSDTTYKDTNVETGKTYQYAVKSVISTDYGKAMSGYQNSQENVIKFYKAPQLNNVSVVDTGVRVSWYPVDGVSAYKIMRRPLDKSAGWTQLGTVDSTVLEFTDTTADLASSYIYTVRSVGELKDGSYRASGIEFAVLDDPQNVSYTFDEATNGVKISWQDVPLADQYNIYIMDENGQWELVKEVEDEFKTTASAIIVPEKYGKIKYTVTALRDGTNETPVGRNEYEMDFYPQIKYTSFVADKKISLIWSKNNVDGYNVYRKEVAQDDSQFVLIGSTTDNFFDDTDVENDVLYTYQVKAIVNDIEQYVNLASHTVGISTTLTCEPKINTYGEVIYLKGASEVFGYNFEKDKWEPVVSNLREYQSAYLNDGKYRYAFANEENGFKSILENNIVDHEWFDLKAEYTLKLVDEYTLEVKITNPPENLEEYEVRVGTKEITVEADGSDTYTCELSYFCNTSTNYAGVSIRTKNKNGDVSITADKFYYMHAPEISEIKRQSNGYVELTINQGNYDDIGWDGYYIYRKVYGESEYERIAVLYSPCTEWYDHETTYTDTTAEKGVKYVYLVKSYKEYEGKTYVSYYDKRTVK